MNILDHISESLETISWVKIPKLFDADADPGIFSTLDLGWKKFGMFIQDPQHLLRHSTLVVTGSHLTTSVSYSKYFYPLRTPISYLHVSFTYPCVL